ncbi:MAG: alpha amylase C-terminal domain-containing protein, partial [Candidatus Eremiobacteraeota bacterium]|nr:alpha amylase C-terminal domain-containing protein [Candidatus Eremiobacteraeota bacterium]
GVQHLIRDLNGLYATTPALFELDCERDGFAWIDPDNAEQSIFSYLRFAADGTFVAVVVNFTPVVRTDFRLGVPQGGPYREVLNTDATVYGGSGVLNEGTLQSEAVRWNGREHSLVLTVPPLAAVVLARSVGS